jgi:hypothetical protein
MLIESSLYLSVEVQSWTTMLILELHLDLAPELVIFGEYRYHGNWQNPSR